VQKRDAGVWDEASLGDVWRALYGSYLEPSFILMAFGSCRVAESLSPRGTDVELREHDGIPCACVRISYQIDDRGNVYDRVKTEQSARIVLVPGTPGVRLAHIARQCGDLPLTNDGLGGFVGKRRLRESFMSILADAGVEAHDMRSLRRTWRTIMRRRMRLPEWVAEPLMGHVPSDVTSRHYDVPEVDDFVREVCDAYARYPWAEYEWATAKA
jgi:integrase